MGECDSRHRVETTDRSTNSSEWEVFIRGDDEALTHVGSVTALTADDAHERVGQLFDWAARDVWVCPSRHVVRFVTETVETNDAEETVGTSEGTGA